MTTPRDGSAGGVSGCAGGFSRAVRLGAFAAVAAIALALAGATGPASDEASVASVLAAHCRARRALSTLRARFVQTRVFPAIGDEEKSSGTFYYRSPDAFRWEYAAPDGSFTVLEGRQGWAVFPRIRQARRLELQDSSLAGMLAAVGFGPCTPGFADAFETAIAARRRDAIVLSMRPLRPDITAQFTSIELTLDPRDHLPRHVDLNESSGNLIRLDFVDLRRDVRMDPAVFRFAPPEDYEVIH